MTSREMEQLQRLLDKKAKEEQENKEFFTEIKKRRREVLAVLDIDKASYDIIMHKAANVGVTIEQLADVVQRIPSDWIHKMIHQTKEQG